MTLAERLQHASDNARVSVHEQDENGVWSSDSFFTMAELKALLAERVTFTTTASKYGEGVEPDWNG